MKPQRGFTLIEVLVALVIVALGMSALMETMGSSADTATWMRDRSFAQWIAFNQLTLTRLTGQVPGVGQSDGELDFGGRHWRWRQLVTSLNFPGVVRIDVMVQPGDTPLDENHWMATVTGGMGDAVYPPQVQSLYPEPGQTSAPTAVVPTSATTTQSLDATASASGTPLEGTPLDSGPSLDSSPGSAPTTVTE